MGFILDESRYINSNVQLHTERMGSKVARFLEQSPTYVRYYHINNTMSMADLGFDNVERMLGKNSPVKFDEVSNLPIYGIEQILIDLNLDEQKGMDGSYDMGEGTLLPNTVRPVPGDFFTIDYLEKNFVFQVTEIRYDTIKSNNFYKISFSLKSVDPAKVLDLQRQTVDRYSCIPDNVGTDEYTVIKNTLIAQMNGLREAYNLIERSYLEIFYDKKYNVLLFDGDLGSRLYDRYLTQFVNRNRLFESPKDYTTIRLSDEDVIKPAKFNKDYKHSIYRAFEEKDLSWLKPMTYVDSSIVHPKSIFVMYSDRSIMSTELIPTEYGQVGVNYYVPESLHQGLLNPPKPPDPNEIPIVTAPDTGTVVVVDPTAPTTDPDTTTVESTPDTEPEPTPIVEPDPTTTTSGDTVFDPATYMDTTTRPVTEGEDKVFSPTSYTAEEPAYDPLEELIPNETDSYEPIPTEPTVTIIDVPTTTENLKAVYASPIDDYLIQFMEGKSRDPEDLLIDDLKIIARDMEATHDNFIIIPLLLFVLKQTVENLSH